jgi:hypothetical protein
MPEKKTKKRRAPSGVTPAKQTTRWVAKVKTDSTHPPEGLFTKSAGVIARSLASRKVSPKGPVSGLRMLTYFLNRGGKGLSAERRAELEKAKSLLAKRVHREKEQTN